MPRPRLALRRPARRTSGRVAGSPAAVAVAVLTATALALVAAAPGVARPRDGHRGSASAPPAADDGRHGYIRNILPPGSNGNVTALGLASLGGSTTATPTTPPHYADQLEMYDALTKVAPSKLTATDLTHLYKDEGFTPDTVVSSQSPISGLTIQRDSFGVPYVTGSTFDDVEYGAGYAAIEDRMFLMDVLRHTGAADMVSFLGNTPADVAMDQSQMRSAFYTRAEATAQIETAAKRAGAGGPRLLGAVDSFVAGINAAQKALCPTVAAPTCPVEYTALQKVPTDWDRADVVYVASLVGGIFGKGGGNETANAAWLQALTKKFGPREGRRVYDDLREKNDPEAPATATVSTPYELGGIKPQLPGVALPDATGPTAPGSGAIISSTGAPASARNVARVSPARLDGIDLPDGTKIDFKLERHAMSNAVLVSRQHSATGHPLAVMGPQTGYYAPQLLTEEVLKGPGIMARGVAFAGTNLFVQLGRGLDYAWSATSAGSDIVDTVVQRLCNTDGSKPTVESTGYRGGGRCKPMLRNVHTETSLPNATSPSLPTTYDFQVLRTDHGIVQQRATVKGVPVALVSQRSTYGHEVDSVIGFGQFNDPRYVHDAASFQQAASHIDFTFNWFYADSRDISYYSSGLLPERSKLVDSDLPHWSGHRYDWQGWVPFGGHVHQTDPKRGYFVSWNNKPAPDFGAADDNYSYGPVYRSLALETRLKQQLAHGHRLQLKDVVGVMAGAAVADSRAAHTLPWLLRVIGNDPRTSAARALLSTWLRHGALRVDRDRSGAYSDQAAIAIFDAWWQTGDKSVAKDVLRGRLGRLVDRLPQAIDDHPRQGVGSSFNGVAWYGYVDKDLRTLLHRPVRDRYHVGYCGDGRLSACRATLRDSLRSTVAALLKEQGVSKPSQLTYDKTQDDIRATTGGVVGVRPIDWQNRPTFQQIVAFTSHR